jgi:hypothetical protein
MRGEEGAWSKGEDEDYLLLERISPILESILITRNRTESPGIDPNVVLPHRLALSLAPVLLPLAMSPKRSHETTPAANPQPPSELATIGLSLLGTFIAA